MNTQWKSYAQWPKGTIAGSADDISNDTHDTEEQAKAVCCLLLRHGFGGHGKVFPVLTWTEPTSSNLTRSGSSATVGQRQ